MDWKEELITMQTRYDRMRWLDIRIKPPEWLTVSDSLTYVFKEKTELLKKGSICFAHIVQANTILFNNLPDIDCPAQIVYSTDVRVAENPSILWGIANELYRYKHTPLENVPKQWRDMVRVVADEYDRSDYTFSVEYREEPIEIHLIPILIFRKHLPQRKLCGSMLPVIVAPNCKSALVLPKLFWTRNFKTLWVRGEI